MKGGKRGQGQDSSGKESKAKVSNSFLQLQEVVNKIERETEGETMIETVMVNTNYKNSCIVTFTNV